MMRKYIPAAYCHIFQISADRGIAFCTIADRISLFTIICIQAEREGAHVIALTIMMNHFHIEASFRSKESMERFMQTVESSFVRVYNARYGLSGRLFKKPYGSSVKYKSEKVRDTFIYISNNAKVKHAVARAEDYQWNFLKYAESDHPFSESFDAYTASRELVRLIRRVVRLHARKKPVVYSVLESARQLDEKERRQLVDYIIGKYNVIDYTWAVATFGSMSKAFDACSMVGGDDYDVSDDFEVEDYRHYGRMFNIAAENGYDMTDMRYRGIGHDEGMISPEKAAALIKQFRQKVGATDTEIRKFFSVMRK